MTSNIHALVLQDRACIQPPAQSSRLSCHPCLDDSAEENLVPPISRASLRELDDRLLQSNVQILHDLIFEPNMRIRSNREQRGTLDKRIKAEQYWNLIGQEVYKIQAKTSAGRSAQVSPRLRLLIKEIKEILIESYPQSKVLVDDLTEYFDIELIIQQLSFGTFDPVSFAGILQEVMKANCAPRRDPIVDQLVRFASEGRIVEMLQHCFDLLELMKLDLANYRLSKYRPAYLKSFGETERRYFNQQVDNGSMDYKITSNWIQGLIGRNTNGNVSSTYEVFVEGIIDLLSFNNHQHGLPETFILDITRIDRIRREYQDLCIISTLLILFRQFAGQNIPDHSTKELKTRLVLILSKCNSDIHDLTNQIYLMATHCRQKKLSWEEQQTLWSLVDRVTEPENGIFTMIETRIQGFIKNGLLGRLGNEGESKRQSISGCHQELLALTKQLCALALVNWIVHEPTYTDLIEEALN